VNRKVVDEKTTTVERWDAAAGAWADAATVPLRYAGKSLELALPRDLFGPAAAELAFDFHWCDNPAELKDPISLCTDGDSAPNRRFNYRFLWKAE